MIIGWCHPAAGQATAHNLGAIFLNQHKNILIRSFSLLAQRKRTKRKGSQSLGPPVGGLSCAALKKQTPQEVACAPPRRFSAFCSAARLREMAFKTHYVFCFMGPHSVPLSIAVIGGIRR
jgi:hypothetical protein